MSRLCGCSDNGGYYFLFSSRSTRFIEPYQRLKSRYAISKPLRKGSRSPEQPINRISRDCRPLLRPDSPAYSSRQYCQWHCRGAEHRQKFPRRDSTQRLVYFFPLSIFFHFSFFFFFYSRLPFAGFREGARTVGGCECRDQRIPWYNGIRPLG